MAIRSNRRIRPLAALGLLVCVLAAPGPVAGQDPIVPLKFSFSDPGARSMGLGGAFVALADDATAAFSNPAGLTQLVEPEVSIEGRRWSYSTRFTERGRVEGLPSGFGADTMVGLRTATSDEDITGLAFLSLAYPRGRWSFAFFRHQLASFEFSSETQGLFGGGTQRFQERFFDQRVTAELDFESYGGSAAYRASESLDLGFGVIHHDAFVSSLATQFLPDEDPVAGLLAPTSYLPERSRVSASNVVDDADWSLIGGILWRLSDRWRIGGVYRQGLEVAITVENTAGEMYDDGVPPGEVLGRITGIPVEFPWMVGLGCAYRDPDGGLTLSFQWDRIAYSTIAESIADFAARVGEAQDEALDDADELHLGGEYLFLRSTPVIAVRLGTWLDPDHQIRHTGDDPFLRALQPRGEDEIHFALGLGVAFQRFQIDLGMDFADQVDTLSVSAVYTF